MRAARTQQHRETEADHLRRCEHTLSCIDIAPVLANPEMETIPCRSIAVPGVRADNTSRSDQEKGVVEMRPWSGRAGFGPLRVAAPFGLMYLYVWLRIDPSLIYHVQEPVFRRGWTFFHHFLVIPGGPTAYIAALLGQTYVLPWLGALVVTLTAAGICAASWGAVRSLGGHPPEISPTHRRCCCSSCTIGTARTWASTWPCCCHWSPPCRTPAFRSRPTCSAVLS